MARMVKCIKLGATRKAWTSPLPATRQAHLRERLQGSWQAWIKHQTMLINENKLNLADPRREIPRRADGEAFLRIRSRRGFRLRATGQVGATSGDRSHARLVPSRRTSAPRRANNPLVTTPQYC